MAPEVAGVFPLGRPGSGLVARMFYPLHPAMPPLGRLDRGWMETEAAMPLGWHLDSLRCTSTGLAPEQRSDRWVAVAVGPHGEKVEAEGGEPVSALAALARLLVPIRGTMSG